MRKFVIIDTKGKCTFHEVEDEKTFILAIVRYIVDDIVAIYEIFDENKKRLGLYLMRDTGDESP